MFSSQMVRLKIAEPSNGPLFPCFPRKWYALKLPNRQVEGVPFARETWKKWAT